MDTPSVEWKLVSETGTREHAFPEEELKSLCGRKEKKTKQLKLELGLPPPKADSKCLTCEMCLTKRDEKADG